MRGARCAAAAVALGYVGLLGAAGPQAGSQPVQITEWPVPWERTRPRDPFVDAAGRVWFVGQAGDYIGALDPESGKFSRFELDAGTGPHNLVVDADGTVWYTGNRAAHIGKLDPASGSITKIAMPDPAARDPHTLVFDAHGDLWFTVQGGNFAGKLETATGKVHLIPVPTPRARPYGIVMHPDGHPWLTEFGSNKLARIDPDTMQLREIELPRAAARPRRLATTSDGAIWYVDYAQGYLGRLDPDSGAIREWPTPAGRQARPYGMVADAQDRLWFVETGPDPNRFVGFDPGTEEFFSITEIGSGGGTVRHMFYRAENNEVWFGTDANTIGRARLP